MTSSCYYVIIIAYLSRDLFNIAGWSSLVPACRQAGLVRPLQMYYVYVIKDEEDRYYTGLTNDLERRLKEHKSRYHKTTKHGRDWKLIFHQAFSSREEARNVEKYLKSGSFRELRKYLVS